MNDPARPATIGDHATDPIGARNVFKERDETERKEVEPSHTTQKGTDADALYAVRLFSFNSNPAPEKSTYVPYSGMLFKCLYYMETHLCSNRYFSSKLPYWCPYTERIYYGTLFFIQILRCMKYANMLNGHLRALLRDFEEEFDLSNLPIAGPLVPFFRALCVCQPPLEEYEVVLPFIPYDNGTDGATDGMLHADIRVLLPNLVALRRAYNGIRRPPAGQNPHDADNYWHGNLNAPVAVAHNAANESSRDARICPGSQTHFPMSNGAQMVFQRSADHSPPVPFPANGAGAMTWREFLGFDGNFTWFSRLASLCASSSRYFNGGCSLAEISPVNGVTGLIVCQGDAILPDRNGHRAADAQPVSNIATYDTFLYPVPSPSDAYAFLTQINYVPPDNFNHANDNAGQVGSTRLGPYWDIDIVRSAAIPCDPEGNLELNLVQRFFLDRPSTKL
jgi:hypothetical protein